MAYIGSPAAPTIATVSDGTVTSNKLADDAVTSAKITDGAVTPSDLSTGHPNWDSSGNVGIGTTNPSGLGGATVNTVTNGSTSYQYVGAVNGTKTFIAYGDASQNIMGSVTNIPLIFRTSNTERMRILSSGGITFNGDTSSSNALDDYEEGTWTPVLNGATSTTYNANYGFYTKIGNVLNIWMYLSVNIYSDGNGAVISGLPFSSYQTESALACSKSENLTTSVVELTARVSNSNIYFMSRSGASTTQTVNTTVMNGNGASIQLAGVVRLQP